jgi:AraC-like DNA-binding protein
MHLLSISENILLFISGFGILQAFILAFVLLLHPRSDRTLTIYLAFYIICLSIPMAIPIAQHFFSWQTFIFLAPFTLLIGPALYLYVRSFKERITLARVWPHLIMFFVYLVIIWRVSASLGAKYPQSAAMPEEVLHSPYTIIPITIRIVQMLYYYYLARKSLGSYQHSIQHLFSETSRINLSWMRLVITGYLVIVVTTVSLYSLVLLYTDYFSLFILINAAAITPYIYLATFKGVTQATVWQVQPGTDRNKMEAAIHEVEVLTRETHSPANPTSTDQPADRRIYELAERVVALLENEKLYEEPELTLRGLAEKLETPTYLLSQAINEGLQKTFYDLVNGYRVEEAKRLLLDSRNRNYTILSVGFEAGFNSKTTFNTVFKKFTGLTPTEFRDSKRVQLEEA